MTDILEYIRAMVLAMPELAAVLVFLFAWLFWAGVWTGAV